MALQVDGLAEYCRGQVVMPVLSLSAMLLSRRRSSSEIVSKIKQISGITRIFSLYLP